MPGGKQDEQQSFGEIGCQDCAIMGSFVANNSGQMAANAIHSITIIYC